MLTLVIGGARSGKSRYAQSICAGSSRVAFIATSRLDDDEMRTRAARHRLSRPPEWLTIEEPLAISGAVQFHAPRMDFVLLDCLTVWLGNFCWERRDCPPAEIEQYASDEIGCIINASASSHTVIVTNEVGYGIVPESPLGRLFRDLQGLVNQQVARDADFVYQTVAGLPIPLKPRGGNR